MGATTAQATLLRNVESFVDRHIGPRPHDVVEMLKTIGFESLQDLVDATIPSSIRMNDALDMPDGLTEEHMLDRAKALAAQNRADRSFIGMGYHSTLTPAVIGRNILENPGWYTQYTPYQAEISQGRLEALLNFQTMITDLTGLEITNASMLDEGTAAAEAMTLCYGVTRGRKKTFLVADDLHPQTLEVLRTRANPLDIILCVSTVDDFEFSEDVFGVLVQYPATDGCIVDHEALTERAHEAGAMMVVAADILSLTLLKPPGDFGADVAVGSTQRFGVPVGYGGPHAAYFATRDRHKRRMPGRLVGVSRDVDGAPALRLALQTREQHIRRDRATSNICTSQVLLAIMASMYGVYHGPEGLRRIATRVKLLAETFAAACRTLGLSVSTGPLFDTVWVQCEGQARVALQARAEQARILIRPLDDSRMSISVDEATTLEELDTLISVFSGQREHGLDLQALANAVELSFPASLTRQSTFMTHPVFSAYRSEHEMLRYMHRLQARDLSLTTSMIPLGSCTMKLNPTTAMLPISFPGFSDLHPFCPREHAEGFQTMFTELESWLAEITGLPAVSLQPNAGSQGEYAGLLCIRAYHRAQSAPERTICLIPDSAHGTNPASAVMAGMKVVVIGCDRHGNIDLDDLKSKAETHAENLAALMITYPSTHGVFEEEIKEICTTVHDCGGLVYVDGANMNAQVGLCRPGDFGADVIHLNLHKTFSIPHGGGGPGVGPIAVSKALSAFLPNHGVTPCHDLGIEGAVAAAPWGSAGVLPISWMYMGMMGREGLKRASQVAILNANYLVKRLEAHYPILYRGKTGQVAHEFIIDLRAMAKTAGITVADVAKRLMDYGFHAPTMSWPVAGTLMVEPTESESREELDRFADALIGIRREIRALEEDVADKEDNLLRNAPHTAAMIASDDWRHPYTRTEAAYPNDSVRARKFWPAVRRIDDAFGDRNLVCSCLPIDAYTEDSAESGSDA